MRISDWSSDVCSSDLTSKIRISGTMYATMRHPIVTASVANMMQAMSGDRFRLMFARAVPAYMKMLGAPGITMERLADVISIVRRLWAGETVTIGSASCRERVGQYV